jgi:hypothetical protein
VCSHAEQSEHAFLCSGMVQRKRKAIAPWEWYPHASSITIVKDGEAK